MYRTHTCGELRKADAGKEVRVSGWIHSVRDHGGVIFIDLRDNYGLTQIVIDPERDFYQALDKWRVESVVQFDGVVVSRSPETVNPKLATGEIEVSATGMEMLGEAEVLPFQVAKDDNAPEAMRLKYRFLDLRKEKLHNNIILRSQVIAAIRAVEKDAVIVVGTPRWSQNVDDAANDPIIGYDNLMYTLHFYAGTHKEWLREKGDYAMSKGLALFVTECGGMNADGQGPIDEESTEAWIEWMDENDISYAFWSISDKKETCSMLYPSAASEGPWRAEDLSPWGTFVKEKL